MRKTLPKDLTSYDLFKTFAVILMIVDHVGYYFFPEEAWWRVAGRLCVPIWFFLVGYAQSRDLAPKIWIGALLLVVGDILAGRVLFPLNILATIIAVRLLLDPVMVRALHGKRIFWLVCVVLLLLALPTMILTEYGTQGLLMAMFGYLVRHQTKQKMTRQYFVFVVLIFVFSQTLIFELSQAQFIVLSIGSMIVMGSLYFFKPQTYPVLTQKMPRLFVAFLHFTGRQTLEIYVVHLLLFKALEFFLT